MRNSSVAETVGTTTVGEGFSEPPPAIEGGRLARNGAVAGWQCPEPGLLDPEASPSAVDSGAAVVGDGPSAAGLIQHTFTGLALRRRHRGPRRQPDHALPWALPQPQSRSIGVDEARIVVALVGQHHGRAVEQFLGRLTAIPQGPHPRQQRAPVGLVMGAEDADGQLKRIVLQPGRAGRNPGPGHGLPPGSAPPPMAINRSRKRRLASGNRGASARGRAPAPSRPDSPSMAGVITTRSGSSGAS